MYDKCGVRYFLAVCEHGSFTAAAKACRVSQPSVTTGIHRLERAVGDRLFERRHPIRLTLLGSKLLPFLQELQAIADRAYVEIRQHRASQADLSGAAAGPQGCIAAGARRPKPLSSGVV